MRFQRRFSCVSRIGDHRVPRASTILGRWIVKVEPRPGSLSTVMSPPIIWQKRLVIASPRPVPPYLQVVDASAWENSWNSLPICSGVMPMPVSATAIVTHSRPFSCPCRAAMAMVPRSLNLLALLAKLSRDSPDLVRVDPAEVGWAVDDEAVAVLRRQVIGGPQSGRIG